VITFGRNGRSQSPEHAADAFGAAATSGNRASEQHNHLALRLVGNHNLKVLHANHPVQSAANAAKLFLWLYAG
jgi:hypothetical protein